MNENSEMTIGQKKKLASQEFDRKYKRYWLLYWGLFFVASLSFLCGLVLPFMREDMDVQLNWGTALVSTFYALGFLTVGEGAFNYWFDKITDSDPDNGTQKVIAGLMLFLSGVVSLSTALATSYIIAWWIRVFDSIVTIPSWAQKYIAIVIPVMVIANVAASVLFKWVSEEAMSERDTNARIRESENEAKKLQAKARADYIAENAPVLARQMGQIEAQDQLDALQAQINEKRIKRGQPVETNRPAPSAPVRPLYNEPFYRPAQQPAPARPKQEFQPWRGKTEYFTAAIDLYHNPDNPTIQKGEQYSATEITVAHAPGIWWEIHPAGSDESIVVLSEVSYFTVNPYSKANTERPEAIRANGHKPNFQ